MIVRNLDQLRSPHRIESLVSREATFLFNNLLFVALALLGIETYLSNRRRANALVTVRT